MGTSNEELMKTIRYYQQGLDKSTSFGNNVVKERKRKSTTDFIDDEENQKHKLKKFKHCKDSSVSEDDYKKHKRSSKSSRDRSSNKSKENTKHKSQEYASSSERDENKSRLKHSSHNKSQKDSNCEKGKSSPKHKSRRSYESSSDKEIKHDSKHESKSRHYKESSSKLKESRSHPSRSDKHEKKDKKEKTREESKEKYSRKKGEPRKHEEKFRKFKDEMENDKEEKSSNSHRPEESKISRSSSNRRSSSEKKSKDNVKEATPANAKIIMNGVDFGSGVSFAEALGMCDPLVSKSSSSNKKKSSYLPGTEKPKSSSSYMKPENIEIVKANDVPNLLKQQPLKPLNLKICGLLSEMTSNYRPICTQADMQPKKMLTQDESLGQFISKKNMRTKVYSGNKSCGKVDTLADFRVRFLQDNIDALEYPGGVPYLQLKPVLDKATPAQLLNMEHHNPYLIEKTDELWLLHYEREAKLREITANIKQSQDKSKPIATTKLAYIDSVVKPPRTIAKIQAKNGILFDKKPAHNSASRIAALALSEGAKKVVTIKSKKAPLMAKTLSFLKKCNRR
ncbi:hypothetical protein NQ314_001988 [Rhamnusium bicolor]|uniref:Elongin-A n=1 Tax=Rhamnusium bicolor TaxID=1586634 RepID=A0AAV8ZQK8_9CUCU|nr:hypothetical protein NQ314_001988 [Rhamnusium bicolor]